MTCLFMQFQLNCQVQCIVDKSFTFFPQIFVSLLFQVVQVPFQNRALQAMSHKFWNCPVVFLQWSQVFTMQSSPHNVLFVSPFSHVAGRDSFTTSVNICHVILAPESFCCKKKVKVPKRCHVSTMQSLPHHVVLSSPCSREEG